MKKSELKLCLSDWSYSDDSECNSKYRDSDSSGKESAVENNDSPDDDAGLQDLQEDTGYKEIPI